MKLVQRITDQGIGWNSSWSNYCYYECDSLEEYQEMLDNYTKRRADIDVKYQAAKQRNVGVADYNWHGDDWNAQFVYHRWSMSNEQTITASPRNRCSDGWHYTEGNHITGEGFIWHEEYERSSQTVYIMKPGVKVVSPKTEEWLG